MGNAGFVQGIIAAEEEKNQEESKKNEDQVVRSLDDRVSHSLLHRNDLPFTTSQVDLPESGILYFLYLSGEKMYSAAARTLYVYLLSEITSLIATYSLSDTCRSGMISDNRLYIGGVEYLKIYELKTSLTQPLAPVAQITTKNSVYKILRVGH
jgi:hypothetical protein